MDPSALSLRTQDDLRYCFTSVIYCSLGLVEFLLIVEVMMGKYDVLKVKQIGYDHFLLFSRDGNRSCQSGFDELIRSTFQDLRFPLMYLSRLIASSTLLKISK